jgi:hypothetical protein
MSRAGFAFAQARLHAQLARRLEESDWQILETSRDFGHCLDVASRMPIGPAIAHLTRDSDPHRVEQVLHANWIARVDQIAVWVPLTWQEATRSMATLPQLRTGSDGLSRETPAQDNAQEWLDTWQAQMPDQRLFAHLRLALAPILRRSLGAGADLPTSGRPANWPDVARALLQVFRKQAQTPAAILAYLGLAALDYERLRGVLSAKSIFAGPAPAGGA